MQWLWKGSFKNVDIRNKITSIQFSWLKRLFEDDFHVWKIIPLFLIDKHLGKNFKFYNNIYINNDVLKISFFLSIYFHELWNIKPWEDIKYEYLKGTHKIYWLQTIDAIPKTLKDIISKDKGNPKNLVIFDYHIVRKSQICSLSKLTSKELYLILVDANTVKPLWIQRRVCSSIKLYIIFYVQTKCSLNLEV